MAAVSPSLLLKPGESIKPIIDVAKCKDLIKIVYGLDCVSITELNGYDDINYKVFVNESSLKNKNIKQICKDGYVLKIMNSLDSKKISFVEAQNDMMLFLSNNGIICPTPVQNCDGQYYTVEKLISGEHVMRLMKFIPGSLLHQVPICNQLLYQCGVFAATIDKALTSFSHPAYQTHQSMWMLDAVPELVAFTYAIKEENKKKVVEEVINKFNTRVLKLRDNLERGLIHGDFNEQNIVVENLNGKWAIKGILDFGDSQHSCYLFELAIAVTYMIILTKDLDAAGYVIAGYSTIRKMPDLEFSLLRICVAARICQSLVMGAYTNLYDPQNSYVLVTAVAGWELLQKIWYTPEEDILRKWKDIAYSFKDE